MDLDSDYLKKKKKKNKNGITEDLMKAVMRRKLEVGPTWTHV